MLAFDLEETMRDFQTKCLFNMKNFRNEQQEHHMWKKESHLNDWQLQLK